MFRKIAKGPEQNLSHRAFTLVNLDTVSQLYQKTLHHVFFFFFFEFGEFSQNSHKEQRKLNSSKNIK